MKTLVIILSIVAFFYFFPLNKIELVSSAFKVCVVSGVGDAVCGCVANRYRVHLGTRAFDKATLRDFRSLVSDWDEMKEMCKIPVVCSLNSCELNLP
jgi:hypothetical protein